ncbi:MULTISPECIES: DUF3052 domain-containing protein [unclassified Streptomyces]|uniref:DUF3052 domain-containing protein n=1 Tax=unclassified Streptomyces TaxID=2593676 RepID=UPI002E1232C3|nr:DUF3052 domain-containing protein [Streptomyces sp. NBC_01324]
MTAAEERTDVASKLGFTHGQVVLEIGCADDVDEGLRAGIVAITGKDLVDEDHDDVGDAVLLWFRDEDGDLTDALCNALTSSAEDGVIWVLTPKTGRAGHVEPSDISEAATTAGLTQARTVSAAVDWSGTRLIAPQR